MGFSHWRRKGYAELEYQVKFGERDDKASRLCDGHTAAPFVQDFSGVGNIPGRRVALGCHSHAAPLPVLGDL